MIGHTIGPYQILAKLGEGGMGEVYRATDTNLKRSVAIKALPASVAADADRLARFQREAEVLAALNHPNIAGIYGLEKAPDLTALVMELVEGEDLSERIRSGAGMPLDEALPIAKQIAEALEAAHEQGIIHRDLKPANIKVRPDGTVKVLDFGLAKVFEAGAASVTDNNPTITTPAHLRQGYGGQAVTQAGVILGTAAYMSPEQARGRAVDKRADIWAFGVVLFEMLIGAPLFQRDSLSDTLAAVLKEEPPWDRLPVGLASGVRATLARCLEKDPRRRLRDIGDATLDARDEARAAAPVAAQARRSRVAVPAALAFAALVVGGFGGLQVGRSGQSAGVPPVVSRLSIPLPADRPYLVETYPGHSLAIAPDGSRIAYVARDPVAAGGRRLLVRALDSLEFTPVPGAEDAYQPFFSPDGQWLGYFADGSLRKVPLTGGPPVTLVRGLIQSGWSHASWSEAGWIAHDRWDSTMGIVPDGGGAARELKASDGESLGQPEALPGTDAILYTAGSAQGPRLDVDTVDGGHRRRVLDNAAYGRYLGSGHLLFARDGVLMVAPFDLRRQHLTGPEVPLPLQVKVDNRSQGAPMPQLAVSRAGTLAYVPTTGALDRETTLSWLDRAGRPTRVGTIQAGTPDLRLSPDGTRLAIARRLGRVVRYEVLRLDGMTTTRVADVTASYPAVPVWHSGGHRLIVTQSTATGDELWSYDVDGTTPPSRLAAFPGQSYVSPQCLTADGRYLSVTAYGANNADVVVVDLAAAGGGANRTFVGTAAYENYGCFSPDGRLLAYTSDESGRLQVYVRRFPGGEDVTRVSRDGGTRPRWSPRGDVIYFNYETLMASPVESRDSLRFGMPRVAYTSPDYTGVDQGTSFDVAPDGRLLVRGLPEDPYTAREIVIVQHWFQELTRLTAPK